MFIAFTIHAQVPRDLKDAPINKSIRELRRMRDPAANQLYMITDRHREGLFYYDASDVSSSDDSAIVLVSGGKRLKRIFDETIYPEWWGAVGDGVTDDGPAFNAMYRWIEREANRSYTVGHKKRIYLLNTTVNLPKALTSAGEFRRLKINGNGVTYKKTNRGAVLSRRPFNQSNALNAMIGAYALTIEGLKIEGTGMATQVGLHLAALYTPIIHGCYFLGLDSGIVANFWLNGRIENNIFTNNVSVAFKGSSGEGYWANATTSNSAFNVNLFSGNRILNKAGSWAGLYLLAADGTIVRDHISEGSNPRYDIYNNSQGSPVVNGNSYENIWFETVGAAGARNTCFYLRNNGTTKISGIQNDYSDTLVKFESPAGNSHFIFQNIQYWPVSGKLLDAGGVFHSGSTIDVNNCGFFYAKIFSDPAYWVGDVTGFEVTSVARDEIKTSGVNLSLRPNANAADGNKLLHVHGSILSGKDNVSSFTFGGNYTGNTKSRYHTAWFGDGGVWVSQPGKYGFGGKDSDADYLHRPAAGKYSFNGFGQLRLPGGSTAQRVSGSVGDVRYNSDSVALETFVNGQWNSVATRKWVVENLTRFPSRKISSSGKAAYNEYKFLFENTLEEAEVVLTADQEVADREWEDVAGLEFFVEPNKTYQFRFVVTFDAATIATGSRWSINGPALIRTSYGVSGLHPVTSNMNGYDQGEFSEVSEFMMGNRVVIEGVIRCSSDGSVVLRHASEVAGSAIIVKDGYSYVRYRQMD